MTLWLLGVALLLALTTSPSFAQADEEAGAKRAMARMKAESATFIAQQDSFLLNHGLLEISYRIEHLLREAYTPEKAAEKEAHRPKTYSLEDHREITALTHRKRAKDLAMRGFTVERIMALAKRDIDILEMTLESSARHSLVKQAMVSELVVVGRVEDVIETLASGDGFRSSVVIKVEETLIGQAPGDEIILRLTSGRRADGGHTYTFHDLTTRERGRRYLLFLSNMRYRFFVAYPHRGMEPRSAEDRDGAMLKQYFFQIFERYPLDIDFSALGRVGHPEPEHLLADIRRVGRILKESFAPK